MRTIRLDAEDGLRYAAKVERIDGRPRLAAVTITAPDGVDLATANAVPLAVIAARALAVAEDGSGRPTPEVIARAYSDVLAAREARRPGQPRVSIRRELASRFGVSPFTIDDWLQRIRSDSPDLLPEPFTGRGFRPSTPEETPDA